VQLAINNAMNALPIWFGWQDEDPDTASAILQQWTGATAQDIEQLFEKWRGSPKERSDKE
jgi:hypothetical protein